MGVQRLCTLLFIKPVLLISLYIERNSTRSTNYDVISPTSDVVKAKLIRPRPQPSRPRPGPSKPRPSHRSQGQGLKPSTLKAKAWTIEAKAIGRKAKAFKYTTSAEIKICSTSDSLTG